MPSRGCIAVSLVLATIAVGCTGKSSAPAPTIPLEGHQTELPGRALLGEQSDTVDSARQALLAWYDVAGYPEIRLPLVQRIVGQAYGATLCEIGFSVPTDLGEVFFRSDLRTSYGSTLVNAVPSIMRRATDPEPRLPSSQVRTRGVVTPRYEWFAEPSSIPLASDAVRRAYLQVGRPSCRLRVETNDAEFLDAFVRARWAATLGLSDSVEGTEDWLEEDLTATEERVRSVLCDQLCREARWGLTAAWMPRSEVAALLRRALAVCPDARRADVRDQLARVRPVEPQGIPGTPTYVASLLEEQGLPPTEESLAGANWDPIRRLRDPADELHRMGRAAVPALLARLDDRALTRDFETVGEIALDVLGRIAQKRFTSPDEARAWWARTTGTR
jgi:hypothetical protein